MNQIFQPGGWNGWSRDKTWLLAIKVTREEVSPWVMLSGGCLRGAKSL